MSHTVQRKEQKRKVKSIGGREKEGERERELFTRRVSREGSSTWERLQSCNGTNRRVKEPCLSRLVVWGWAGSGQRLEGAEALNETLSSSSDLAPSDPAKHLCDVQRWLPPHFPREPL